MPSFLNVPSCLLLNRVRKWCLSLPTMSHSTTLHVRKFPDDFVCVQKALRHQPPRQNAQNADEHVTCPSTRTLIPRLGARDPERHGIPPSRGEVLDSRRRGKDSRSRQGEREKEGRTALQMPKMRRDIGGWRVPGMQVLGTRGLSGNLVSGPGAKKKESAYGNPAL